MRQSNLPRTHRPQIPERALHEVEQALDELALLSRAAYRRDHQYIDVLLDGQPWCRLEFLGHPPGWALEMPGANPGDADPSNGPPLPRQTGSAAALLETARQFHLRPPFTRSLGREVVYLKAPPRWAQILCYLLFPITWPLDRLIAYCMPHWRIPDDDASSQENL
jgi:hypothetical protein